MKKDRILGILSIAMATLLALLTAFTVDPTIRIKGDPGAQIMPYLVAGMFALAGLVLVIRKPDGEDKVFFTGQQWKRLFILFIALCGYVFLIWIFGFNIATFYLFFTVSSMFAKGQNVPNLHRIIYSVIMTILIYFAFRNGLKVFLPTGIIEIF